MVTRDVDYLGRAVVNKPNHLLRALAGEEWPNFDLLNASANKHLVCDSSEYSPCKYSTTLLICQGRIGMLQQFMKERRNSDAAFAILPYSRLYA